MAQDMAALMRALGHERYEVLAHDRGARVAHRLGLDHPTAVTRLMLLDIAPTLDMYEHTTRAFAQAYFHWFWLIQPAPMPETMIERDPVFYLRSVMGGRPGGLAHFSARAMAEYERARLPGWATGICEDYRASATVDLEHDRQGRAAGERLHAGARAVGRARRGGPELRCAGPVARHRRSGRWRIVAGRALSGRGNPRRGVREAARFWMGLRRAGATGAPSPSVRLAL